jgi:3-hydroxyacyl-CoA dehydrogenase
MSKRIIRKVAILGSGVMGSRIACHFAGTGIPVLLLDMEAGQAAEALTAAVKSSPSPVYTKNALRYISTGSFSANLAEIKSYDWIIEVVVERLDIKQQLFTEVEKYRSPGTLITSNTSGIPIHLMAEGRSDDFKKHFCGTHFFNPPRYLKLLEIIQTAFTNP